MDKQLNFSVDNFNRYIFPNINFILLKLFDTIQHLDDQLYLLFRDERVSCPYDWLVKFFISFNNIDMVVSIVSQFYHKALDFKRYLLSSNADYRRYEASYLLYDYNSLELFISSFFRKVLYLLELYIK